MSKFTDIFDKVYMISLPDQVDRRVNSFLELDKAEIYSEDIQVVDAISGSDIEFEAEKTAGWNPNAKALAIKTLELVKNAKKKGYKSIFIFEDDLCVVHNFKEIFNQFITGIPEEWDFLHLNATHKVYPKYYAPYTNNIVSAYCCQAYAISENVYDAYIEKLSKLNKPIDEMTSELHEERGMSYCPAANIIYHQRFQYSTLREKVVEY